MEQIQTLPATLPRLFLSQRSLLGVTLVIFLWSLLAIFPAPARLFWIPAIVATEAGHWLSVATLIVLPFVNGRDRFGFWAVLCGAMAICLFLTPLMRAKRVATQELPTLVKVFPTGLQPLVRTAPLRLVDLARGISVPKIQPVSVAYSADGSRFMDIFPVPNSTVLHPVLLVIHGGSWQSGDRKELPQFNRYWANRGYAVAAIDYRLGKANPFPAARDDVWEAVAFLKKNGRAYGMDSSKIVLMGRSAGGQVAVSAAYERQDPSIKGVISFYAPNDLAFGYSRSGNPLIMKSQKLIEAYIGGTPQEKPGVLEAASPVRHIHSWTPPTFVLHGGRDELVWPTHSFHLTQALRETRRPHFFLYLPWATHGCDALLGSPSGQLMLYGMERFLASVVR